MPPTLPCKLSELETWLKSLGTYYNHVIGAPYEDGNTRDVTVWLGTTTVSKHVYNLITETRADGIYILAYKEVA